MRFGVFVFGALLAAVTVAASPPVAADGNEAPAAPLAARSITAGGAHTCALTPAGGVRCWGGNGGGQLGLGDTTSRLGRATTATALGTGRTAIALVAGAGHTCAILDNGTVKCWGGNSQGQLGLGDTATRGDQPGEMGDSLPTVPLGTGRTATAITGGRLHTCALLDNGTVKCWGLGYYGIAGQGDGITRGDGPGEMGDSLPTVPLGTGRTATAIASGSDSMCAILDNASLKCWGDNDWSQLGLGDTAKRGDQPGEMGDSLPAVSLGTGRTATAIVMSPDNSLAHTCALLDNGMVKCWGDNQLGELGAGDADTLHGNTPLEMGDNLPAAILGTGRTATAITTGKWHSCALLDNATVKCWGNGPQLGLGSTAIRGLTPAQLGDNLPAVDLGTGRTATAVTIGDRHTCALLDNATVKCWGDNSQGELGLGDTSNRGDGPGEMGDELTNAGASVNNVFANAQVLAIPGTGSVSADTGLDDTQPGEPDHAGDPGGRSVWYRFTATSTGTADIDTFGSGFDTVLAVYTGTAVGALTPVASNNDSGGPQSQVQFPLTQGTTYRIAVDGVGGASGTVVLNHTAVLNPTAGITTPVAAAGYQQHQVVAASYACVPPPGGSQIVSCVGNVASGQPINTATPGPKTFTVTATDQAGNIRVVTSNYTVIGLPAVAATITADQGTVIAGEDIDYHVTITNTGPTPLTSITVLAPDVPVCLGPVPDLAPAASTVVDCSYTTTPADVPMMTNQVLIITAQGAFGLSGTRRTRVDPQVFRPDALIAIGPGTAAGNGIYNTTGTQQAKAATVPNLGTATFRIPIQNDGNTTDTYAVEGLGTTSRYTVTYKDGPTTITTEVTGDDGFVITDLAPGAIHEITLIIKANAGTPVGNRLVRTVTVTSAADGTADTVKAAVTRR